MQPHAKSDDAAVIMTINLDVTQQIINAMATILRIVHTITQVGGVGIATSAAILPAAHPLRNGRQSSAPAIDPCMLPRSK